MPLSCETKEKLLRGILIQLTFLLHKLVVDRKSLRNSSLSCLGTRFIILSTGILSLIISRFRCPFRLFKTFQNTSELFPLVFASFWGQIRVESRKLKQTVSINSYTFNWLLPRKSLLRMTWVRTSVCWQFIVVCLKHWWNKLNETLRKPTGLNAKVLSFFDEHTIGYS